MRYYFVLILFLAGLSCGRPGVETVTVKGSDSEVNLVLELAEIFMEKDPDISISVTGGGSGAGIAALINRKTDIANSSRPMKEDEIQMARDRQVTPNAIIFAIDALTVIAHPSLGMDSINLETLGKIYRGEIVNWSEFGGPDKPITLYGRQSNSGTFVFFRDRIVKGEYSQNVRQMNGTAQIIESVKQDPTGIGYVGVGYVVERDGSVMEGINVLAVKETAESTAILPLKIEDITSGRYPIARPLFQYVNGVPGNKLRDFLRYELSEEGQSIVIENGFFPVSEEHRKHNQQFGI